MVEEVKDTYGNVNFPVGLTKSSEAPKKSSVFDTNTNQIIQTSLKDGQAIEFMQKDRSVGQYAFMQPVKLESDFSKRTFKALARPAVNLVLDIGKGFYRDVKTEAFEKKYKSNKQAKVFSDFAKGKTIKELYKDTSFKDLSETFLSSIDVEKDKGYQEGLKEIQKQVEFIGESNKEFIKMLGIERTGKEGFYDDILEGFGSIFSSIGLAYLTKNPEAVGLAFGLSNREQTTQELLDLGIDYNKARTGGAVSGFFEGALESYGLDVFLKGISGNKLYKRMALSFAEEFIQEGSQSLATDSTKKYFGAEKETREILKDATYSAFLGGIVGGLTGGILGAKKGEFSSIKKTLMEKGVKEKDASIIAEGLTKKIDSKAILDELGVMLKRENSNLSYKGSNVKKGVDYFSKIANDPNKLKSMFDIKENVKAEAVKAGASEEEATVLSSMTQTLGAIAFEEGLITPEEFIKNYLPKIEKGIQEDKGVLFQEGKGYVGYSKSVNAVEAEAENRMPATYASKKLGVKPEAIKEFLDTSEWHHYGKMFNKVNVYDINPYLLIKEGNEAKLKEEGYSKEEIQEFKETFEKMKSYKKPKAVEKKYKANIEWIEWVNKKPKKHSLENVDVIEKGQFYTFKTKDGDVRKKIGSNGTYVVSEEQIKRKEYEETLDKKIKEINDAVLKKLKEGKYKEYLKENNLDKPSFKEFEEFNTDTNVSNDNFYIEKQKPTSKQKEDGLRRIHKENDVFQLQEWDGNNWNVLEERKEFNPKKWDGKEAKNVYDFVENDLINPYTLEEKEEAVYNYENKNDADIHKQGEKGSFNVSEKAISITKNADYSTLPHELSHFWLDNIWNYTKTGSASPEYMENFKAIKNWLGITNEQLFLTRKQQEKFAKGYEKYLTEGSLPNRIVGNAFDSYDKWLKKVYKASALKNNLSPEAVEFFRTMTTGEFVEPKNYEPERTFEKNKEKAIETIEKDSKEIITERQKQYKDEKEFESTTVNKKGISSVFEKQSKRVDSNETLEYDAINLEEQNKLAKEYVENNPEEAKDVINGIKNPPEGIVKNAIYNAYLKQTLDVGDTEAYLDALKNQSLDLTKAGQELVTQRGADDILSGSYWIKKIENGRKKKIVTKTTSYIESFKSDSDINSIFEKKIDDAINNSLDKILKIKDAKEQQKQINILTDMISKDLNVKPEELFQKELKTALDKKEALRKYIRNNLNEKLGISVKVKEAEDILNKVEKVRKVAENTIDKNGNPSVEFFKRLRELENFTNSLNPTNPITVLTSIIGRASMLASIKSPVVNISSNTINMGLENISRDVVRKLNNESLENKVSKEKQKKYLKYSKDVYNQSGFIVSDMEELESDMKVRGEKITEHSQGKGVIRKIGRFYENTVFKYLMGYPDVFAKDITFVKVAGVDATNIAIKEGAKDITKRANELFDDAIKIEPSTKEGKKIRENAIKEAKIVTYTQDSGLAKFALSLRNIFNKAANPIKLGTLNSPFVQVPANVYSLMLDYTFGSSKGLLNAKKIYNDFKNGELSDSSKDSLRATSRNAIGVLASSIILSSLVDDDDDYIPDYALLTPSERAIVKEKNGVFNSVKIGDNYISLEAFGPLAMPLVSLLEARRRTGKREKIAGYFKGAGVQLMSMPVIGDLKDMYEEVSRRLVEKEDKTLESLFDFSIDFLSARTIPAIATDIAKTFDKYERDTMRSSINTVLSKIPLARETLPTKTNMVTGDDIETNPYQLLFGSRVKVANESFEIGEIDRLKKNGYNVTITDPTKYGDLKKLSEEDKVIARKRFAEIYSEKIRKIMGRSSWDNLKDEKQAKKLNEIRRKAVEVIKKEFKEQE